MSVIKTGHGKQAAKVPRVSPDHWVHLPGQLVSALLVHLLGLKQQGHTHECVTTRLFFKSSTEVVHIT